MVAPGSLVRSRVQVTVCVKFCMFTLCLHGFPLGSQVLHLYLLAWLMLLSKAAYI